MKRWKLIRWSWFNVGYTDVSTASQLEATAMDSDGTLYYTDENGNDMQVLYPSTIPLSATTTSIVVTPSGVTLLSGGTDTQQLIVLDQDGKNVISFCTFVSDTPTEATVSSTGLITGIITGSAIITVTHEDGPTITDTCAVTVS